MRNRAKSLHNSVNGRAKFVIIYRPISQLKLDPRNPRAHSKRQVRQIARSIETFGFNVPVLIDADFKVIAGHGRILAAQQLGLAEVVLMSSDFNQFVELEKGRPVIDMEEAYIMYVALTRAREKLILSPACVKAENASNPRLGGGAG